MGGGRGKERLGADPTLRRIASKHGASPHEVALAWLLARSDCLLPIPDASRVASIESSVRAVSLRLDADDLRALA
ncbi:MAG: hypothetical protein OHK0013_49270 [Sandaracinaceae bacterium]